MSEPTRQQVDWAADIDLRMPIAAQIHDRVKRAILKLELPPNARLSEKELSLRLGTSRTPVREALIKLSEEGLVDILPQRGTYVAPIRIEEVMEARFIREALEVAVVAKATEQCDAAFLAKLDTMLEQQHAAVVVGDMDAFLILDDQFHHAFSLKVALPRGWKLIQSVKSQLDRVRYLSLPDDAHLARLFEQHSSIVAAVRARDPELAADHMRTHLREVFSTVDRLAREQPHLFGGGLA